MQKKKYTPSGDLNQGPLDLMFSTLPYELKRYPPSAVLVVVLVNPNHYIPPPLRIFTLKIPPGLSTWQFQGQVMDQMQREREEMQQ